MTLTVIINLVVCVCALAGFIMGVHTYFKPRQPLYSQMVTIALGCAALGRLYNAAAIVCGGEIPRTFNTGVLATIGCFMFFFSANYGQMDSLCDMGEKSNRKIRWIALLAPLVLLGAAVLVMLSGNDLIYRITCMAEILFVMLASYYNLKHLLIHDVAFGIIGSIRGYNLIALLLEALYTAEIVLDVYEFVNVKNIIYVLMSICLLVMIPVLKRGGKKWKV